ncbi:outer membrane beta-barrel protein [Robiginitalea marina]|uniref:Porin family protein n=1 Tax=Robiginitalea marina TaxID=2954105 RepID=A0ABT1AUL3_9FLAO|nr:outer membrane beta-barrel protein [Robiginitalea marina]MCO5723245.1 porin family protein [Robiginitalea marina]
MRRFLITASLLALFTTLSFGQTKFALTYSVGFPSGETSDYLESTSWRGVNIDYQYFIREGFALGFSAGWQVFNDDLGFVTETTGTETLSGFRYNYLNSFPILVTGSFYLNPSGDLNPYAGLGIGLVYSIFDQDTGLFRDERTGWPFSLRPEIGLDYEVGYNVGIRASFRYNYVASGDELPSLPYYAFNIGLVWSN